ncbi:MULTISPECIES: PTS sugar transporter subunit IIA [Paenibacillus]|uniref:Mannitol-specific phosphotransferase enzyme IIA component n=1 Tax=Paenibacillus naphthalenovorans TaxID=162209 RepID=A0A0U2VXB9_9BACL|nr:MULTISPECIES: PTS sugar transporter subunit IIA [Paenibacillus]ALS24119.1 subunit EIIA of PTS mannitol transporter [Paenibacillus naphthalenovorans]NTZ19833.1 PTS mannitol transporter subunit IIA [Paenibacillus sp. JMULE4]GCL72337.1 PTS mannitol transporter subunit IIA [Paenibacillus naphthalenovorans]SDJ20310.1 PTS system, mannitol-specific IIA component [Paenibacillus naphthalenovorans]
MSILSKDKVKLNAKVQDKYEAIRMAGQLLVDAGHASVEYIDKMIEREQTLSTYMGGGLAIPHGTKDSKELIRSTGLSIVQIPEGVDFGDGEKAHLVVGIAAAGDDHLDILTNVAMICSDDDNLERILKASTAEEMIAIFESGMEA